MTEAGPPEQRPPSRSRQRRDALAVLAMAERLVELGDGVLAKLPLTPQLLAAIADSRRIRQQIARKRQLQYLAKLLRREPDLLEPLRQVLEHDRAAARREAVALHRLEHWRDRLIDEGDAALTELLDEQPGADRQRLRQLARRAREERGREDPLHATRELFRALRGLFGQD
ncbi:MAG TPA: ribosome biogenesis factor YjgA [Xanthomonadaceae bacterium]|nr:ribosome biogenesis factor YjgA [Xanthomonadaceae bacterium]